MSDITFARPGVLIALVLIPLVLAAWAWGARRAARRGRALSRARQPRPPYLAAVLLGLAAGAALVAAAQPQWGTKRSSLPRRGADLVIVMDISRSMDARDVSPSRLAAAKEAVVATFARLGGDRAALVVFGGTARVRFPLTSDLAAASQVVSSLETGAVIVEGGSSASAGLDVAIGAFEPGREGGRLVVLITDGDDLGPDPAAAAQRVRDAGIELIVVGAGTPGGATVPIYDPTKKTFVDKPGPNGQPLVSKLNEPFLQALAEAADGRYLGDNLSALPGAVAGRLSSLQRAQIDEQSSELPVERYRWFAAAALAALVLATVAEWLARVTRRSALVAFAGLALLLLPGCAARAYDLNEQGRAALDQGDNARAVDLFLEAVAERPDDPRIVLNLAAALQADGRFEEAGQAARRALLSPDPALRARAYASLGHHQFSAGQTVDALGSFKQALLLDPSDRASRHDYEVLLALLQPPGASGDPNQAGDGASQDPVATGPEPNDGSPPPGDAAGDSSQPTSGRPATPQEVEQRLADLDRQIAEALEEAGDPLSAAEAISILTLLAERDRIAAVRDALKGGSDPNDY